MSKPKNLETEERVNNLTTYSTEEIKTGEKWIDGKDIYRKTFVTNGKGKTNIEDLNYDEIFLDLSNSYLIMDYNNRILPLVVITVSASVQVNTNQGMAYIENGNLVVESGSNIDFTKAVITVKYTKK